MRHQQNRPSHLGVTHRSRRPRGSVPDSPAALPRWEGGGLGPGPAPPPARSVGRMQYSERAPPPAPHRPLGDEPLSSSQLPERGGGGASHSSRLREFGDRKSTRLNSSHVAISY